MNRLSISNGILCWIKPALGVRFCSTSLTNSNDQWQQRGKFGNKTIQRHESPPTKVYYAPEWQLDKTEADKEYDPLRAYGTTPEKWEYYNKIGDVSLPRIHPFLPKRMWNACQLVRRMNAKEACMQLNFKQNKASLILAEVIKEAMDRAKKEFHIENPEKMYVAEAFHIQSNIIKGRRRHARDNWTTIRYRYINLFVRLEEGEPPTYKEELRKQMAGRKCATTINIFVPEISNIPCRL
uniref:Large ribosomal subunit protein uL22m n=1 Tax=Ditylenchus dipsaci TaxID=166011 RepID=A0A915DIY6_9BILA